MLANHVFWRLILFNTHLQLPLLQSSMQWLSIVVVNLMYQESDPG